MGFDEKDAYDALCVARNNQDEAVSTATCLVSGSAVCNMKNLVEV